MAVFYFDTSAIVKRYHRELGTEVVDKILEAEPKKYGFAISFWAVLEFAVVFSAKTKRKEMSKEAFNTTIASFLKDALEIFAIRPVNDNLVASAISIAVKYALPSADCLQLASALELKRALEEAEQKLILISSDKDLCKAAEEEGLNLIDPEEQNALAKLKRELG